MTRLRTILDRLGFFCLGIVLGMAVFAVGSALAGMAQGALS